MFSNNRISHFIANWYSLIAKAVAYLDLIYVGGVTNGIRVVAMSHKSFSLKYKLKVIEEAERHKGPKKDLCVKYGIALPTLFKNQEKIRSHREASGKRRKMRSSCNKTIDKVLFLQIRMMFPFKTPLILGKLYRSSGL